MAINALSMQNLQSPGDDWYGDCFAVVDGRTCWVATLIGQYGCRESLQSAVSPRPIPGALEVKSQVFLARDLETGQHIAEARVPVGARTYAKASDFRLIGDRPFHKETATEPKRLSDYQKQLHEDHARRVGLDPAILPWVQG